MVEEMYHIPANPQYREGLRKLQDSDPASASTVFNPLFERIIENIAAVRQMLVRHNSNLAAHRNRRHVVAVRERDPSKPVYGLDGGLGLDGKVILAVGPCSDTVEVAAIVNGVEYEAKNIRTARDALPDGSLVVTKL